MQTEYRLILTATFPTLGDRDTGYDAIKTAVQGAVKTNWKRADMTKDEYQIPDAATTTEKVA